MAGKSKVGREQMDFRDGLVGHKVLQERFLRLKYSGRSEVLSFHNLLMEKDLLQERSVKWKSTRGNRLETLFLKESLLSGGWKL